MIIGKIQEEGNKYSQLFGQHGYKTINVINLHQASHWARKGETDIIVVDLEIRLNGAECVIQEVL